MTANCKCVNIDTAPCLIGTVCDSSRPGFNANSNRSIVASAYVFPIDPSSFTVCSTNIAGLLSYIPVFGFTNIEHDSVSVSSHTASPRVTFAVFVSARLCPRLHSNFKRCVPGRTLYALCARTSNWYLSTFHPRRDLNFARAGSLAIAVTTRDRSRDAEGVHRRAFARSRRACVAGASRARLRAVNTRTRFLRAFARVRASI